jgi:hypothetical protein
MSRAIGDKRGSVRGAPPQVYVPFLDESDDKTWNETWVFFRALFWLIIIGMCLQGCIDWASIIQMGNEYE